MGFIKAHQTSIVAAIVITIFYFLTRLVLLTNLPIFTDEAIYIRWAQIALQDHNWLFISLTDGKQPLFIWLVVASLSVIKDPLFAARLISVFSGLFAMAGLFTLTKELFKNEKIAFISSILYLLYPFALVYDRMALYDSLVGAFWVWSLYFVFRFIKKPNLFSSLVLGIIVGVSNLNKSNFFLPILISPIVLFINNFKNSSSLRKMVSPFVFVVFSGAISFIIYSTLRVSPFFYIINQKNAVFIFPLKEWLANPLQAVGGNLHALWGWFNDYTSPILLLFILLSFAIDKKYLREKLSLLSLFVIPFLLLAFTGRVIYPRYILFMALSLLPLIAYSVYGVKRYFKKLYLYLFALFLFSFPLLKTDFYILSDFSKANIPFTDKFQYYVGWPAGHGISESVEFFKKEAKKGPIFIGTGGTFGLMPMSYDIYLSENKNIKIKGYWPIENTPPQDLMSLKKNQTVYFVFYQPCPSCKSIGGAPDTWGLTKVINFPNEEANLTIYKF